MNEHETENFGELTILTRRIEIFLLASLSLVVKRRTGVHFGDDGEKR